MSQAADSCRDCVVFFGIFLTLGAFEVAAEVVDARFRFSREVFGVVLASEVDPSEADMIGDMLEPEKELKKVWLTS